MLLAGVSDDEDEHTEFSVHDAIMSRQKSTAKNEAPVRRRNPFPSPPPRKKRTYYWKTFLLCASFFGLGLCIAIPGPTLLDLQVHTDTTTREISYIFTARSLGYLVGSLVAGAVYDCASPQFILSLSMFLAAIATVLAPLTPKLLVLMLLISFQGAAMGVLDTGGNVMCMQLWGADSGPYLQSLHFAFGMGAFVAPLLAEPFLSSQLPNSTFRLGNQNSSSQIQGVLAQLPPGRPYASLKHTPNSDLNDNYGSTDGEEENSAGDTLTRGKRDAVSGTEWADIKPVTVSPDAVPKPKDTDTAKMTDDDAIAGGQAFDKDIKDIVAEDSKTPEQPKTDAPPLVPSEATENGTTSTTTSTTSTTTTKPPTTTTTTTHKPTTSTTTVTPSTSDFNSTTAGNSTDSSGSLMNHARNIYHQVRDLVGPMSTIKMAYAIVAAYLCLVAVLVMCSCCGDRCNGRPEVGEASATGDKWTGNKSSGFKAMLLFLLFFFYLLYVGGEVCFGQFISAFAVMQGWDKSDGAYLTAVFWGSLALGRFISIFLARCVSPAAMMMSHLGIVNVGLLGLIVTTSYYRYTLWIFSALAGIGMSSIFATGFTWLEQYIVLTGRASSVMVVGSALGEMVFPLVVSFFFDQSPMALMYTIMASALVLLVIFVFLLNLVSHGGRNKYSSLPRFPDLSPQAGLPLVEGGVQSDDDDDETQLFDKRGLREQPDGGNASTSFSVPSRTDLVPLILT